MAFARTPTVQKPAKKTFADRYMIVPCEAEGDLAVIWDRQEEQVVDVISASASSRFSTATRYTLVSNQSLYMIQ